MPFINANQVMLLGLSYMGFSKVQQASPSYEKNSVEFKKHYSLSPHVVAQIWHDLCTTDIEESKLSEKEKGQKGLTYFLMVMHFIYVYPRNCHVLASRFGVCNKLASGQALWKWASRLAGLHKKVIYFP